MPTDCAQLVGQRVAYSHAEFRHLVEVVSDEATVDNRYYKLTYQRTTGRVISLFDKTTKRELLASEGLGFFTFVRERARRLGR